MNSSTYFISDLHLDASRPEIIDLFVDFVEQELKGAIALYILGDFFEYWVGDDQPLRGLEPAVQAIRKLVTSGVPVFFIAGNRDFLVGNGFVDATGVTLLDDEEIVDLYGERVLIMHGDSLCTDDVEYQSMRQLFRSTQWKAEFLAAPIESRISQALALRERSMKVTQQKQESITDVNGEAVLSVMLKHGVDRLIHGHTHRPNIHNLGAGKSRVVLGDWYEHGSVLRVDAAGYDLAVLELTTA